MNKQSSIAAGSAASFRPPQLRQVTVGGFFGPRIDTIATKTAHMLFDRCIEAGMLDQVDPDRPNPGIRIPFQHGNTVTTQMFWDSDFGKSIETAAYALYRHPDAELERRVDEVIDAYARLQAEDGYLNSWYQRIQPGERWTNLRDRHELYNAGHLIEGAVAYFQATGKRRFLDILSRYADHIATVFGTGEGQLRGYPGHPELELALVKLARATGERRYLALANYFVDQRGQTPNYFEEEAKVRGEADGAFWFGTQEYNQSHEPVRDQRRIVGHAVRATYLYSGMADVRTEFADETLTPALEGLWSHLTEKNLYVTGGLGPSAQNEGLTFDYDLPNASAYAETCASVALVFWASRMLGRGPDRRFSDVMEQALYNGALSGISLDGETFFYENPLESRGDHHRWRWHRCPCCPPNLSRLIASIGTYIYGLAKDEIAVHLYCESEATVEVASRTVTLTQRTAYPRDGRVEIEFGALEAPARFALSLRIPGWASGATLAVDGEAIDLDAHMAEGYVRLEREWRGGERIVLDIEMVPRLIFAHPNVGNDQGRAALARGPLVYCLEGADNGSFLNGAVLPAEPAFRCEAIDDLGGLVRIACGGRRERYETGALYRSTPPSRDEGTLTFVPYYAWDNREPGEMLVWVRREAE
ncbi:MAG: beta-L-arabinofuranosidase domain-containing protein [Pseudomonadota bacterium]|nr:beta-L-arabinofuranosidase domain-containing protein [Pseudomonadota bacterium]